MLWKREHDLVTASYERATKTNIRIQVAERPE